MASTQTILDRLDDFINLDKFSSAVWEQRGLIASPDLLFKQVSTVLNECARELKVSVKDDFHKIQVKRILKRALKQLRKSDYDTEEKELIAEYFYKLASIVNINFAYELNTWLYGIILATLTKISARSSNKIAGSLSQPCTGCGSILKTNITSYVEGIPEDSLFVVRCNECDEFNLISVGENVKGFSMVNYRFEEQLSLQEMSGEEAMLRFEQIRFFRKK